MNVFVQQLNTVSECESKKKKIARAKKWWADHSERTKQMTKTRVTVWPVLSVIVLRSSIFFRAELTIRFTTISKRNASELLRYLLSLTILFILD